MNGRALNLAGVSLALAVMVWSAPAGSKETPPRWSPVARGDLCVTEGGLDLNAQGRFSVNAAKLRAVLPTAGRQGIEARFTYLGPTEEIAPLRSGAVRQQFGLKLRATDGCNLVYAMWRFAPRPSLTVSVKTNPGSHASRECGVNGYHDIQPAGVEAVEAPRIGEAHGLAATLDGATLTVLIDDRPVWRGDLGAEAMDLQGPVGIRSDNVRLDLALFAATSPKAAACSAPDPGKGDE